MSIRRARRRPGIGPAHLGGTVGHRRIARHATGIIGCHRHDDDHHRCGRDDDRIREPGRRHRAVATGPCAFTPAGTSITYVDGSRLIEVAAGVAPDGSAGIFIASNRGENMRPVALLEHPDDAIVDMAFWTSGDRMLFVHDHGDSFELHTAVFPSLGLMDVTQYDRPVGDLRIGTDPFSWAAYRVGDCSGVTSVMVYPWADAPRDLAAGTPLAERSVRPVGWTDLGHLIVESRATGCDGPADVWVLGADGSAQQVLAGVEHVAVRDVVRSAGELPNDLNTDAEY